MSFKPTPTRYIRTEYGDGKVTYTLERLTNEGWRGETWRPLYEYGYSYRQNIADNEDEAKFKLNEFRKMEKHAYNRDLVVAKKVVEYP